MRVRSLRCLLGFIGFCVAAPLFSQSANTNELPLEEAFRQIHFAPSEKFSLEENPLVIQRAARPNQPFSVTGERGAILGQQDGSFELWLLPVKVLHNAHLTAKLKDYDTVINLNDSASSIEVRPDHTTITYSHAAITVKQHMFIPREVSQGMATAVVMFEVHATRPAEITLSFAPSMERQWPAPNFGRPDGSWIQSGTGGAYLLQTDNPDFFGAVAMPQSEHGELRPYQERPLTTPLTFTFRYDPAQDDSHFYPLLCAVSDLTHPLDRRALLSELLAKGDMLRELYRSTEEFYSHFFDKNFYATTSDKSFDEYLKWAEIAIEQSKIVQPAGAGLAGGWYTSGDSARPGFGWFFGRDTLWSLYAVNSFGDFELSRQAMDFLIAHQREDGKMMHEYSQTAASVDWSALPYLYAAADATPLFVMQMEDYVRSTGDTSYLKEHWDNVKRAYAFTRAHTTDGVYDNSQGTGWVEEWVPARPHQEIYLAALDQQSSDSMAALAALMGDSGLAQSAKQTADEIRKKLAAYRGADGMYAFSRHTDGTYEYVPSIFPSVSWWSGHLALPNAGEMFDAWGSHQFSTDWGTRSVAANAAIYDPISYHHGSVWPLYTGWVSMAEYRTDRALAGYQHLRESMNLTDLQDPGAITEVISGAFYEPLGRSSSHQLWSSAMVVAPAIRGLFGLEANALEHILYVNPHLPAQWKDATLHNVKVGGDSFTVTMTRQGDHLLVEAKSDGPTTLCMMQKTGSAPCAHEGKSMTHRIIVPLAPVEIGYDPLAPREGDATKDLKFLQEDRAERRLTLKVEGVAGSTHRLFIRKNGAGRALRVTNGEIQGDDLVISFPQGKSGEYVAKTVVLSW